MVNPGKIVKGRKSKRQTLHNKHKVERKVREHHRKERRDLKRNPQLHRKKKDPGIPNSWPFKQQMIQQAVRHATVSPLRPANNPRQNPQRPSPPPLSLPAWQELQREKDKESIIKAHEDRKRERMERRKQEKELQRSMKANSQQRREQRRVRAAFAQLPDVLSEADVVLMVLDARDPAACRCAALERALIDCDKLPVLVLNKVDLVPRANAEAHLAALRRSFPTVPFCCAGAAASGDEATSSAAAAAGIEAVHALLQSRAAVLGIPDEQPLTVGIVGFDCAGKRTVLRELAGKGAAAAGLGPRAKLLPRPARLEPLCETPGANDVLLRKVAPASLPQPEALVGQVLERCERRALLKHFELADFDRDEKFLKNYAKRHFAADEPTTGAAAQRQAAIDVLRHWSAGEMGICTPAMPAEGGEEEAAAVALGMAGKAAAWEAADARALAVASTRAFVELSPGEADEIDLSLEEAWEGGEEDDEDEGEEEEEDEDGEGEEEEGEEEEGEEMEEDGEEEME